MVCAVTSRISSWSDAYRAVSSRRGRKTIMSTGGARLRGGDGTGVGGGGTSAVSARSNCLGAFFGSLPIAVTPPSPQLLSRSRRNTSSQLLARNAGYVCPTRPAQPSGLHPENGLTLPRHPD